MTDEDGREYVDFILAYGPHILGHGHPAVTAAIAAQLGRGTAFGATAALEVELAERIVAAMPSMEMVRFVNSGTEATMSALRLARAVTGRDRVIKCAGGYHGHADAFLAAAGSGVATLGIPGSPGVPAAAVADTIVVPYNDLAAVRLPSSTARGSASPRSSSSRSPATWAACCRAPATCRRCARSPPATACCSSSTR